MAQLFHITERGAWEAAADGGEYRMSTRGVTLEQQGFIHCSLQHQLLAVADAVYGGAASACAGDLVVLVIDAARLTAPVRLEAAEGGTEEYPHIYGPLPRGAVTAVLPVGRDAAGALVLPELTAPPAD
jgi:uncharacterized protein (DUF952 family)